jgi:HprK-related kinase B
MLTLADVLAPSAGLPFTIALRFLDVPVRVAADDDAVGSALRRYYEPWVVADVESDAPTVTLLQGAVETHGEFEDVVRADGKKVKEATRAIPGGRLILKRQTGVLMGIWPGRAVAAGDVRRHLNQAVNLVNHVYAAAMMARGYRLFHAAAVVRDGRALVLAGVPGAGKSTTSLHFVEAGWRFLSNDRVLARATPDGGIEVRGYPKQPRVNPGTLLHHPRLAALLDAGDRAALRALRPGDLWALERKRDVDLDTHYGAGTVVLAATMAMLVVLRWRPGRADSASFRRLALDELAGAAPLVAKDLGVFGIGAAAAYSASDTLAYVELMRRVPVYEARGGMDLRALERLASR